MGKKINLFTHTILSVELDLIYGKSSLEPSLTTFLSLMILKQLKHKERNYGKQHLKPKRKRLKMKKKRRRLMKKPKTQSPKMMKMTKNSTTKMKTTKKMQMKLTTNCKWMKKNVWALMKQMTQSTVNTSKLKLIRFITDIDKQFFE